jgi:hypothetical protein
MPWSVRVALALLAAALAAPAQVAFSGRVVDDHEAPVSQARVSIRQSGAIAVETLTGPSGAFRLSLPATGQYLVSVERAGFFRLEERSVQVERDGAELTLALTPQREVFQSIDVGAAPSPVDPGETVREQRLSGTEVNDVPYPASHSLQNAMKLMPGVLQDPSGGVNNVIGAPSFLRFYGDEGRHFVLRIRVFGKAPA